jgi:hypothetical protein
MDGIRAASALAQATARDALRRPAAPVSIAAFGALLALLPRLGNPAAGIRDNAALAVDLTLSSLGLAAPLVAGALAVRGHQADDGSGWVPELTSAPTRPAALVVGRWIGACVVAWVVCLGAAGVGALGWIGAPTPAIPPAAWLAAAVGVGAAAALGGALGSLYGAWFPRDLALLVLGTHVVVARVVGMGATVPGWTTALLPDPSRLDLAREVSFGAGVATSALLLGTLGAVLHSAAVLCIAGASRAGSGARNGT